MSALKKLDSTEDVPGLLDFNKSGVVNDSGPAFFDFSKLVEYSKSFVDVGSDQSGQFQAKTLVDPGSTILRTKNPDVQKEQESQAMFDAIRSKYSSVNTHEAIANFAVLKRWEGFVSSIGQNSITAEVVDLDSNGLIREEIEIDLEDISYEDRELVEVGAVFYWHIGYQTDVAGSVNRTSNFRFRRLPAWSRSEIAKAKSFAQKLKSSLFGS